jgi:hypothetical protein
LSAVIITHDPDIIEGTTSSTSTYPSSWRGIEAEVPLL